MEPAGMVHALETVHGLLKPDGRLIDIHPKGEPPPIIVRSGEGSEIAGWLEETDDFIEYGQAEAALAQVVRERLFSVEKQSYFIFNTYADTFAELSAYLEANWSDAVIPSDTATHAEALETAARGKTEALLRETVRISHLRLEPGKW
jgi:hypothetical protein